MLQDPNVERYIKEAFDILLKRIISLEKEVKRLKKIKPKIIYQQNTDIRCI